MAGYQRIILIVLDSVGIGELPDAAEYGDEGSDTLGHIAEQVELRLPQMCRLGLHRLVPALVDGAGPEPEGRWGRLAEQSKGKDSTTGHWEMAGLISKRPFPTYPDGFPPEVVEPFEEAIGLRILGNKAASGTVIIEELGAEHLVTGRPIVYTSADSVFQIAAHEEVVPVEALYEWCRIARRQLTGAHAVGRVIARPFVGEPGSFQRTRNRKDFSLEPPPGHLLEKLHAAGVPVHSIGKIYDLFAGASIDDATKTGSNSDGILATRRWIEGRQSGFLFVNLVDFDQLYGHRNNPEGYARALEEFDQALPALRAALRGGDLLIITADHGNDPTTPSTDHSREYVPLLCAADGLEAGDLGTRSTFADLGQTVADNFGTSVPAGESFLAQLT